MYESAWGDLPRKQARKFYTYLLSNICTHSTHNTELLTHLELRVKLKSLLYNWRSPL